MKRIANLIPKTKEFNKKENEQYGITSNNNSSKDFCLRKLRNCRSSPTSQKEVTKKINKLNSKKNHNKKVQRL